MSIVLLRSFVEVYREKSVSRAAHKLNLTQPAVSAHIASLEVELERSLFTRHARGMRPTIIADELALRVSEALDNAEGALADIKARSITLSGTIHICGPSDILSDLIIDRVGALSATGLSIHLHPTDRPEITNMLLEGRADFAFAVEVPNDRRIAASLVGKDELLLVAIPEIADAIGFKTKNRAGIKKHPMVAYDTQNDLVRTWFDNNQLSFEPDHAAIITPDLRGLRNFVLKGLGWCVLPRYVVQSELSAGRLAVVEPPIGNPETSYHLIWLRSTMRSPRIAKARALLLQSQDRVDISEGNIKPGARGES